MGGLPHRDAPRARRHRGGVPREWYEWVCSGHGGCGEYYEGILRALAQSVEAHGVLLSVHGVARVQQLDLPIELLNNQMHICRLVTVDEAQLAEVADYLFKIPSCDLASCRIIKTSYKSEL